MSLSTFPSSLRSTAILANTLRVQTLLSTGSFPLSASITLFKLRSRPHSLPLTSIRRMTNRPSRSQAPPPPSPASNFCLDCGRVMPAPLADTNTPRKYCSASCRSRSKDRSRTDDRKRLIEAFKVMMAAKGAKGVVLCSEAESEAAAGIDVKPDGEGQTRHQDGREEARRAARRLVNFGWKSQGVEEDREVDAVQDGKIVEASFAKGEWGIRWADKR